MQKWEYKVLDAANENQLNELGAEGWELIAVTIDSYNGVRRFYLKRAAH